jgi:hypothetical protein
MKSLDKFQHTHLHNPSQLRDARSNPVVMIDCDHCYFVGFRINTSCGDIYHHAMIAADNEDALYEGLAAEYNYLARFLKVKPDDIAVVFLRNLMMHDPELVDATERFNINKEIKEGIERHDARSFIVYGFVGDKVGDRTICLMEVKSQNAMTAINTMKAMVQEQRAESFDPLEVCLSHPVTPEFDVLFQQAVTQIGMLPSTAEAAGKYLH